MNSATTHMSMSLTSSRTGTSSTTSSPCFFWIVPLAFTVLGSSNSGRKNAVHEKLASVRSMSGVAVGFTLRPVAEYGMPSMWYPTKPTWYSRDSPRFRLETIALMTAVRLAATSSRFVGGAIAHNPSHRPGYRLTNNLMAAGTFGPAFTEGGLPLRSERLPGDLSGRRPTTPMLPVPLHLGTPTGRARQAYP